MAVPFPELNGAGRSDDEHEFDSDENNDPFPSSDPTSGTRDIFSATGGK